MVLLDKVDKKRTSNFVRSSELTDNIFLNVIFIYIYICNFIFNYEY